MKKHFRSVLALIMMLVLMLSGCGEYVPADSTTPGNDDSGSNQPVSPPSEDLVDDPNAFTVCLRLGGRLYRPKEDEHIIAQWSDGFSFYTADIADDGYARIAGLDGDYTVTLKGLPKGYLYNPNAYIATNDDKTVIIDIYKPVVTNGVGDELYNCVEINKIGVYSTQIESKDHIVYFEYTPLDSGTFSIESWMNITEGNFNPKIDVYTGSFAGKYFAYTLDDGGVCEGFTRNFKHIVEIADEQIGHTFTFAIHCDSRNGNYPVTVDFAVQLNGSFSLNHEDKELIIPETVSDTPDYDPSLYTWTWAETSTKGVEGRYQFDGNMFKLWSVDDGGDGYYHVYNELLYKGYKGPDGRVYADGYGPILYAKISSPHRFTEAAFTTIEHAGNSSLTVYGSLNHKMYIEGIDTLIIDPGRDNPTGPSTHGSYFCLRECPCRADKKAPGVCGESCMECLEGCRRLPDYVMETMIFTDADYYCDKKCPCYSTHKAGDKFCTEGLCHDCLDSCKQKPQGEVEGFTWIMDVNDNLILVDNRLMGLSAFTNGDGVYGVTEQLKSFLQGFSVSQRYFADGQGWVETHSQYKVDAKEADQWLFACGYYLDN